MLTAMNTNMARSHRRKLPVAVISDQDQSGASARQM